MRARMRWKRVVSSAVVAVAVGCGSGGDGGNEPTPIPTMTGQWHGSRTELGWTVAVDIALVEHGGGRFDGNGHLALGPYGETDGTVSGLHTHPEVSLLAMTTSGFGANFDGTFEGDDTVTGTVTSPVFRSPISFVLDRD